MRIILAMFISICFAAPAMAKCYVDCSFDLGNHEQLRLLSVGHGAKLADYKVSLVKNGKETPVEVEFIRDGKPVIDDENPSSLWGLNYTFDSSKRILTMDGKSGCCLDYEEKYQLVKNRLELIQVTATELVGDGKANPPKITYQRKAHAQTY